MKCEHCGSIGKFHSKDCSNRDDEKDAELVAGYETLTLGDVKWINNFLENV